MVYFINIPYQLVITGFLNHQRYHSTHLAFFRWQGGYIRFDVSCFKQTNLNTVGCRCCEYPRAASEGKGSRNAGFAVNCPAKTQRSFLPKKSWPTKNITWFWKKKMGRKKTIKTCNERLEWRVESNYLSSSNFTPQNSPKIESTLRAPNAAWSCPRCRHSSKVNQSGDWMCQNFYLYIWNLKKKTHRALKFWDRYHKNGHI